MKLIKTHRSLGLAQALAVFTLGSGPKNVAALSVLLVFLFSGRPASLGPRSNGRMTRITTMDKDPALCLPRQTEEL